MPVLDISLKPSRLYLAFLLLGLMGACIVIYLANFNLLIKGLVAVLLSANLAYIMRRYALLQHTNSILALRSIEGQWQIKLGDQYLIANLMRKNSVVSRWFSMLYFTVENHKQPLGCIILPDSLAISAHKQLLLHLRHL
jgi:uncharacterized membrane protein